MSKRSSNVKIRNYQFTVAAQARAAREKATKRRVQAEAAPSTPVNPYHRMLAKLDAENSKAARRNEASKNGADACQS